MAGRRRGYPPGARPSTDRDCPLLVVFRGRSPVHDARGGRLAGTSGFRRAAGLSSAVQAGRVFQASGRGNAGQLRQKPAGRRQGVADAALGLRIAAVEAGTEFGRPPQVLGLGKNAERAVAPRRVTVDPVRRLAGDADDVEYVVSREVEDRQPVEDVAVGDAHALVAPPGDPFGERGALVAPDTEAGSPDARRNGDASSDIRGCGKGRKGVMLKSQETQYRALSRGTGHGCLGLHAGRAALYNGAGVARIGRSASTAQAREIERTVRRRMSTMRLPVAPQGTMGSSKWRPAGKLQGSYSRICPLRSCTVTPVNRNWVNARNI